MGQAAHQQRPATWRLAAFATPGPQAHPHQWTTQVRSRSRHRPGGQPGSPRLNLLRRRPGEAGPRAEVPMRRHPSRRSRVRVEDSKEPHRPPERAGQVMIRSRGARQRATRRGSWVGRVPRACDIDPRLVQIVASNYLVNGVRAADPTPCSAPRSPLWREWRRRRRRRKRRYRGGAADRAGNPGAVTGVRRCTRPRLLAEEGVRTPVMPARMITPRKAITG